MLADWFAPLAIVGLLEHGSSLELDTHTGIDRASVWCAATMPQVNKAGRQPQWPTRSPKFAEAPAFARTDVIERCRLLPVTALRMATYRVNLP
jgi:hypothetical protein